MKKTRSLSMVLVTASVLACGMSAAAAESYNIRQSYVPGGYAPSSNIEKLVEAAPSLPSFAVEKPSFEALLNEKGITVTGTGGALSGARVASIVNDEAPEISRKFSSATRNVNAMKTYTPVELLELQYYTLSQEERDRFWDEASNNTVKVKLTEKGTVFSFLSYGSVSVEDSNISLPFILFSNRELSSENPATEGTLHLPDGGETALKEYSVSCVHGALDEVKGVKRNITDHTFTYTISNNMEEDLITIQIFGENGYRAVNYIYVTKVINAKGTPVFILKKNSTGIGNAES